MTRVKICGITNIEDAGSAIAYGADALGFIAVRDSPRFVSEDRLPELTWHLPPFVMRVGVYADMMQVSDGWQRHFDALQLYVDADPRNVRPWLIRAYQIKDASSLDFISATLEEASAILLDTHIAGKL